LKAREYILASSTNHKWSKLGVKSKLDVGIRWASGSKLLLEP